MNKEGGLSHKLHGLDHLRAFAIIFVFLYHYGILFPHPEWVNTISKFGWSGVDLFFVLSGYLIAAQLFKNIAEQKNIPVKAFFVKRFFRIIPIYLFTVAVYFLFPVVWERPSLAPLWKYLTFTQNIGLDVSRHGTFSHAWSLCIEEQFYVLFPFILLALLRLKWLHKGYWILVALFAAGFFIRSIFYVQFAADGNWINWYKWIYYATCSRLDGLLTGVSIAALLQFRPAFSKKMLEHQNIVLCCGLLMFAIAYLIGSNQEGFNASVFGFPLTDIGYGCIVLSALSPGSFLFKYQSKLTVKIAELSYGIYLIHKIVIHVAQTWLVQYNIEKNGSLMFILCSMLVFMVALVLNATIETPFLQLRRRILTGNKSSRLV